MCGLKKILGRHLTDFGVCVDRCLFVSPSTLRPFSADILERKQWSRPCSGEETDSWTTVQKPIPHEGKITFKATKDRSGQTAGSTRPQTACPDPILCWVLRVALCFGIGRERCMHTRFGRPILTPYQVTAAPATPMSAEGAVGVCYD